MNLNDAALSPFGVNTSGPTIDDLPDQARVFYREHGLLRVYRRGELVQDQGQPFNAGAWVLQGRMRSVVHLPDGSEQLRGWVMPGEMFGFFNTLLGDCPALSTMVVETDEVHLLLMSRDVLVEMMNRWPDARWGILVGLSRRIFQLEDVVDVNGTGVLEDKLRTLLGLWAKFYGLPARDGSVELWITQNDFANGVGGSRQRVHMELKAMKDRGELDLSYGKVILRPRFFDHPNIAKG